MASIEMQDQEAIDDEQYYDMLYNFAQVTIRANDMALDGHPVKQIAKKLQQSAEAFYLLCKTDEIVPVRANKVGRPKKAETPQEPEQPEVPETQTQPPKKKIVRHTTLKSNLRVRNGWGICPICGAKCIKVNQNTIMVNFLMYCKRCHLESVVTWRYEPKCRRENCNSII